MKSVLPFEVVDCGCTFLTLCANLGEPPMRTRDYLVSRAMGAGVGK
jgi:hypothetical protein